MEKRSPSPPPSPFNYANWHSDRPKCQVTAVAPVWHVQQVARDKRPPPVDSRRQIWPISFPFYFIVMEITALSPAPLQMTAASYGPASRNIFWVGFVSHTNSLSGHFLGGIFCFVFGSFFCFRSPIFCSSSPVFGQLEIEKMVNLKITK